MWINDWRTRLSNMVVIDGSNDFCIPPMTGIWVMSDAASVAAIVGYR